MKKKEGTIEVTANMAGISWDSSVANKRWVIYIGVNQHMAWNHS